MSKCAREQAEPDELVLFGGPLEGVMQPQDLQRLLRTEEMRKLFADAYGLPAPHSPPDIDPLGR